ncbi:copper chaperone PCu(A)C [Bailinhaonella thermotolerans]|uniref:Copper chaperone PCu(A)C n=1 Tax=Bailinhaonella thermotolerans TaxID=1070861 RepID=A0A3A4AYU0_9ACTN|nr:copper chaperone PCu(A)C [Bailinhaonella thermotolerans]
MTAGCAAGFDAQTSAFYAPVDGLTAKFRGITIADAFVLGPASGQVLPAGSPAPLYITLSNGNGAPDTLTAVAAPGFAGQVKVTPVPLPPKALVNLAKPSPTVILDKLATPVRGGENVKVTLSFANAGTTTVTVPVIARSAHYSTLPTAPGAPAASFVTPAPSPTPAATAGGHGAGH